MSISPIDVARTDGGPQWVEAVATPAGVEVWWDEPRPHEGGRRCVVRRLPDGTRVDALPEGWNARNRVVEYGGRSWRPLPGGGLVFTNWADQRLYRLDGAEPVALTPEGPERYGDLYLPPGRDEVWAVRETHDVRDLVAVPLDGGDARVIVKAQDFVMNPRISPPTAARSPGSAGTTPTCPGTAPSCASPRWPPTARRARTRWWRAARASRSRRPSGATRRACTRSPTRPAGGTCTSSRSAAASPAT
ncbi:hypothetical protein [Nonomuraea salmonea]|uniref:hypothetical protein n=1 Tax=Nonomuraea salmonea TaxID=46181 RepID=UPI0031EAF1ED